MQASRSTFRTRSRLFSIVAFLATFAQVTVALAPLAEGRDARMASHVETQGGSRTHFTHSEATCAACQARSIQGTTSRASVPLRETSLVATAVITTVIRAVTTDFHLQSNPRAPPSVI